MLGDEEEDEHLRKESNLRGQYEVSSKLHASWLGADLHTAARITQMTME
jgi:hypothetical protein